MSLIASLFERRSSHLGGVHPRDPALAEYFGGGYSNSAGVQVTPDIAMRSAAIYACVRVLAEDIGALPLQMFRRLGDGSRVLATDHPLYRVVHRSPNGFQTTSEWRIGLVTAAGLRGAAYSKSVFKRGRRMLIPMHPDRVRAVLTDDYQVVYEHFTPNGQREVLTQSEVLRVPYLIRDGVEPISPIRLHAETVAQSLMTTTYTNTFLANGGRPPGFIKMDQAFKNKEARDQFRAVLKEQTTGANRGSTLVLEQASYEALTVSNEDAQLTEICDMSLLDCCRVYRVPPHMVGALDRATWGNVEQQEIGYVVHTLGPWANIIEQALGRDLLTEAEQEEYFFEFNFDGLLRGDARTRTDNFLKGRQGGWLSINDIRRILNLPPIENGDDYLQPLNYAPVGDLTKEPLTTDKPLEANSNAN